MRSSSLRALLLVLPLMTSAVGCGPSAASQKHETVQIRYLAGPMRYCLKGTQQWPMGDLPPPEAALELNDTDALYTARLLDELDAYRKWGGYVVAWCVKPPDRVEGAAKAFAPEPVDECGEAGRDANGECMNQPMHVVSVPTAWGGYVPVTLPWAP